MAIKQADEQERQAQKAHFMATMAWLQDGPANGLRRQHQFTKVKGGGVQPALVNAGPRSPEEVAVEDGLSPEQLKDVLRPPDASMMRTASVQQETEVQVASWHCEWGSELTCVREPEWPADMGAMPPRGSNALCAASARPVALGHISCHAICPHCGCHPCARSHV